MVLPIQNEVKISVIGHVDSGKSTTTGRLLFELGGIPEREMEKLKAEEDEDDKMFLILIKCPVVAAICSHNYDT